MGTSGVGRNLLRRNSRGGFTIVELLIVIVVVAVLATITIVVYKGIQNRANAGATEAVANQYKKGLIQYATLNGAYPNGNSGFCLGEVSDYPSGCFSGFTTTSALATKLKTTLSSLPAVDSSCHTMYVSSCRRNLTLVYQGTATLDGNPHPFYMIYFTEGSQNCKLAGNIGGTWLNYSSTPNATGYLERDNTTKVTMCVVLMPDPTKL